MEENPTRLCMPSHWTGETDSPEVELSKRDRSNAPTPYCLFRDGRKRLWDHSTFIAFQSYSDLARLEYETKVILKYARSFFPTYPNRTFILLFGRAESRFVGRNKQKKENTYLLLLPKSHSGRAFLLPRGALRRSEGLPPCLRDGT